MTKIYLPNIQSPAMGFTASALTYLFLDYHIVHFSDTIYTYEPKLLEYTEGVPIHRHPSLIALSKNWYKIQFIPDEGDEFLSWIRFARDNPDNAFLCINSVQDLAQYSQSGYYAQDELILLADFAQENYLLPKTKKS